MEFLEEKVIFGLLSVFWYFQAQAIVCFHPFVVSIHHMLHPLSHIYLLFLHFRKLLLLKYLMLQLQCSLECYLVGPVESWISHILNFISIEK